MATTDATRFSPAGSRWSWEVCSVPILYQNYCWEGVATGHIWTPEIGGLVVVLSGMCLGLINSPNGLKEYLLRGIRLALDEANPIGLLLAHFKPGSPAKRVKQGISMSVRSHSHIPTRKLKIRHGSPVNA